MKAILLVPGAAESGPGLPCLPLFPLLDRPFVQRIVETLVGRGVSELHLVVEPGAAGVEAALGDGHRWGCPISYHLAGSAGRARRSLASVAAALGGRVLIGRADCLPDLPADIGADVRPVLYGEPGAWTGWAVCEAADLADAARRDDDELAARLEASGASWVTGPPALRQGSAADVPEAQKRLLTGAVDGALVAAPEVRPGVWVARGSRVDPSAVLVPPVFIGECTAVGAGARVGPFAVVGSGCLLDHLCTVRDATVLADTYVGPGVGLDGVIVDGPLLLRPGAEPVAVDGRLLDRTSPGLPLAAFGWRLAAGAGFLAALPLLAAVAVCLRLTRGGPVLWRREFVRTPALPVEGRWRVGAAWTLARPRPGEGGRGWVVPATVPGLVLELLPALAAVALSGLRVVGLPPRRPAALRAHADQCAAVLRNPPGLVTEAALCPRPTRTTRSSWTPTRPRRAGRSAT